MWFVLAMVALANGYSQPPNRPPASGPHVPPDCGPNEYFEVCPPNCPVQRCSSLWSKFPCEPKKECCKPACRCIDGYLRDDQTGVCVTVAQCMGLSSPCGVNEKEVKCRTICTPQNCDISYTTYICAEHIPCERGCDCIDDHLRNSSGICIPNSQCPPPPIVVIDENPTTSYPTSSPNPPPTPPKCGLNEIEVQCQTICPPQSCNISYTDYRCDSPIPCIPGCDCIQNYLRNSSGDCIYNEECPPPPTPQKCGLNEIEVQCQTICPPQSCNISYTDYRCDSPIPCIPGCDCIQNYLRNSSGDCIYNEECPPPPTPPKCGLNEIEVQCQTICPPQSCNISYTDYRCDFPIPCIPGCDCIYNYLRNSSGDCIYNEECPPPAGAGAVEENPDTSNPSQPEEGTATPSNTYISASSSASSSSMTSGESSQSQSSSSSIAQDSTSSNDQSLSISQSSSSNSQSSFSNTESSNSYKATSISGSSTPGTPPPPKSTCDKNETYVLCEFACPTNFCPVNDNLGVIACSPPYPCPPGCSCNFNYKRKSREEPTCILAEECPPVTCTRPSEEWDSCPSSCLAEDCRDANTPPTVCNEFIRNCQPKCVCKKGYYRNESGFCVLAAQCVTCTRPNEELDSCPSSCLAEDCRDANTPPTVCNEFFSNCQPKCVCKKGYYRNESGFCVLAAQCETKCGANQTYVKCVTGCPNNYCPSSDYRGIFVCGPTYYCPPGCACRLGYRRISYIDDTCILAEDCPPVPCTRPNEKWNPCPSCLAEDCGDINNQPSTCNELVHNCQPKCVCEEGYFRNKMDMCVPKDQCPGATMTPSPPKDSGSTTAPTEVQCGKNETNVRCNVECPNSYCPTSDSRGILICDPPYPCPSGCACELGYRRKSYDDKTCILAEECTPVPCTRPNEKWNPCPSCLAEDCGDINNQPSTCNELVHNCQPKCVCEEGYFRNKLDVCIPKDQCPETTVTPPPEGNSSTTTPPEKQCSKNETYVQCNIGCPNNYCPTSDSRGILICDPPYPCPPGCACELGYRRKSYDDKTCILAEECPPVPCTRPNEKWNPCPSCLAEDCRDVNNPPGTCNEIVHNCQPKCICEEGFYRNENDVCVSANECGSKCAENEIYVPCKAGCPNDYCPEDDSRAMFACDPPNPCTPGCICGLNHKKISYDNETCIVSSDCPPVDCKRPNEEWSPCPSPCLRESCRDVNDQPSTCNFLVLNCQPTCVCSKGHFRNENDICVPAAECPPIVEEGTTETPEDNTTSTPTDEIICCGNETQVDCTFQCPYNYCPEDDSRVIYACKPPRDCPSGCGCKLGYRRLSYDNDTCILAEDCPPVTCTRPYEKWDPCPSGCLAEGCEDVNNQPSTCNELVHNCQPKCVCNDGYFRNKSDICIPAADCCDK